MRLLLILGDFILLLVAVPVTLALRDLSAPAPGLVVLHLLPFSLLGLVSIAVFFSAGLYDPVTTIMRRELPGTIVGSQAVNILIAALFFFFVPIFGITPKTNLLIYLLVSALLVSLWHLLIPSLRYGTAITAVLVGDGSETDEIILESKNGSCPFRITESIPVSGRTHAEVISDITQALQRDPAFLIADLSDDRLQLPLAALPLRRHPGTALVNFTDLYEDLFRRVPFSSLSHQWLFTETDPERVLYSVLKRVFDIILGAFLSAVFLVLAPFVWIALGLEGKGPLLIEQKRMGRGGGTISVLKFRSMRLNKAASSEWTVEEKKDNPVTRVGAFLRKTSLDELPQVISVLKGDLSLIGPRSDISGLAERLADAIPFYMLRYTVTPGISGWAQVNQRYSPGNISPQSTEESRVRLMYDLYYVKHRSPLLDLSITLRTLKTLVSRWTA